MNNIHAQYLLYFMDKSRLGDGDESPPPFLSILF